VFRIHYLFAEGTRPSQVYPWCEKDHASAGSSNGQCGNVHVTEEIERVTCAYCRWEIIKAVVAKDPEGCRVVVPIHAGVHPVFCRDGSGDFSHWEARCGPVVHPVVATREAAEITCPECRGSVVG